MISISWNANWSELDSLRGKLAAEMEKAVRKTAFRIEADAKRATPVDTGALRASLYTVTAKSSGQARAESEAKRRMNAGRTVARDEIVKPMFGPLDRGVAYVACGVRYGAFVNYGTSKMPARPFFTMAFFLNRRRFREDMAAAWRDAKR